MREQGRRVRLTGRELDTGDADLVLLCVPDDVIAGVARDLEPGPWLAHTSGATRLAALDPHRRRFSLHPLQTFDRSGDSAQLDGAWAALSAEDADGLAAATELAATLGLEPFTLADDDRPLYHAGAVVASGYLVTIQRAAAELARTAGAPPEALLPLMQRTIDNGFQPTGPATRGDVGTVESHLAALRERRPDLEPLYRVLADATAALSPEALEPSEAR